MVPLACPRRTGNRPVLSASPFSLAFRVMARLLRWLSTSADGNGNVFDDWNLLFKDLGEKISPHLLQRKKSGMRAQKNQFFIIFRSLYKISSNFLLMPDGCTPYFSASSFLDIPRKK